MKTSVCVCLVVGIVVATVSGMRGDTPVGGLICSDTTWNLAGSPYIVTGGGIVVGCDATLTIEAGVVVKFDAELSSIVVGSAPWGGGTLVARGAEESPIVFTSNDPSPAPGDWSRIHFSDYATDATLDEGAYVSGCILERVIVEYAGYGDYPAVFAEKSSPFLDYCEVRHNAYRGIELNGRDAPAVNIEHCEVWDHPQRGIYIRYGSAHRLLYNNIHDNAGGVYLREAGSNTLTGNTIMGNTASDDGGGIRFYYSDGNTLTGNIITNNHTSAGDTGGGIYFSSGGSNTLTGNSITGNTAGGIGGGIRFDSYSGSNTLTGNSIAGNTAGGSGGGIYFDSYGGSNTLTGNSITGNTASYDGGGIYFYWHGGNTLTGNTISDNTANGEGGAMYLLGSDDNTLSSNTITNNHTSAGETGGIYVTNYTQWLSLEGDPAAGTFNCICGNDGYWIYNDNPFDASGYYDIDARYVKWCTDDTDEIQEGIWDYFEDGTRSFVVWYPFVSPGDLDLDGDVDLADYAEFAVCFAGPGGGMSPGCDAADLDCDNDADLLDFAAFQAAFTGPRP
ncbi:MAG: hypothetical protein GY842_02405 [bacterium]|nr:hypothetical protein [bacterium]